MLHSGLEQAAPPTAAPAQLHPDQIAWAEACDAAEVEQPGSCRIKLKMQRIMSPAEYITPLRKRAC